MAKKQKNLGERLGISTSTLLKESYLFRLGGVVPQFEINNDWLFFIANFFLSGQNKDVLERKIRTLLGRYLVSWRQVVRADDNFDEDSFIQGLASFNPKIKDLDVLMRGDGEIKIKIFPNNSLISLMRLGDSLGIQVEKSGTMTSKCHLTGEKAFKILDPKNSFGIKPWILFQTLGCRIDLQEFFDNFSDVLEVVNSIKNLLPFIGWEEKDVLGNAYMKSYSDCRAMKVGIWNGVEVCIELHHDSSPNDPREDIRNNNYRYPPDAKNWRAGNILPKFQLRDNSHLVLDVVLKSSVPEDALFSGVDCSLGNSEEQFLIRRMQAIMLAQLSVVHLSQRLN